MSIVGPRLMPGLFRIMSRNPSSFFSEMERSLARSMQGEGGVAQSMQRHFVREGKEAYELRVELPGVPKEKIKVELEERNLRIAAAESEESFASAYEQTLTLPRDANLTNISANSKDGVLHVRVPKTAEQEKKRISIPIEN